MEAETKHNVEEESEGSSAKAGGRFLKPRVYTFAEELPSAVLDGFKTILLELDINNYPSV